MKEFGNPRKVSYLRLLTYIKIALQVLSLLVKVIKLVLETNILFNL